MQRICIEQGSLSKKTGRLFSNDPLTIVFDLTHMSPGQIARFNDFLANPPTCNDRSLGRNVRRVILAEEDLVTGRKPANPDLFRRLRRMSCQESRDTLPETKTDDILLQEIIPETTSIPTQARVVDFANKDNWYLPLFGGVSIDHQGNTLFQHGVLANLKMGDHLVLKNTPWENESFVVKLATVLREGGFEANDQWLELPGKVSFSRGQVPIDELKKFKEKTTENYKHFKQENGFACINSSTIHHLSNHFRLDGESTVKVPVKTNPLANLMAGCEQLVITSKLSEKQWLWLYTELQQLAADKRPELFNDLTTQWLLKVHKQDRIESTHSQDRAFHYRITAGDSASTLQEVELTSEHRHQFAINDTPLMECLKSGKPVVLEGLETNPKLAAQWETLLLPRPYLFLHGNRIDLPNAKYNLLVWEE